jgi:hypothetical protein
MKKNSRQLIAHYDLHATMLDIARVCFHLIKHSTSSIFQYGAEMTSNTRFDEDTDDAIKPFSSFSPFGSSLLRPFDPTVPRTCGTLKIPFEFCQCQFLKANITTTETTLAGALAGKMACFTYKMACFSYIY